jgi:hypothetical protein
MEFQLALKGSHAESRLGLLAQRRRSPGAAAQVADSTAEFSTFTCGYWGKGGISKRSTVILAPSPLADRN